MPLHRVPSGRCCSLLVDNPMRRWCILVRTAISAGRVSRLNWHRSTCFWPPRKQASSMVKSMAPPGQGHRLDHGPWLSKWVSQRSGADRPLLRCGTPEKGVTRTSQSGRDISACQYKRAGVGNAEMAPPPARPRWIANISLILTSSSGGHQKLLAD